MVQDLAELGAAFPQVAPETWRKLVEKTLGGAPLEDALGGLTDDGIAVKPLYLKSDWEVGRSGLPGMAPFTRGALAPDRPGASWDIRAVIDDPRLAEAKAAIKADLAGGASSLALRFAAPGAQSGPWGLSVATLDDLDALLKDVPLQTTLVALDAGEHGFSAAASLLALWQRRGVKPSDAKAELNIDPIGSGVDGIETLTLGALAKRVDAQYPGVTTFAADARIYHAAGASQAQEIGLALATGAAYLRIMESAGLPLARAPGQIRFIFATDSLFFQSIAKLRAARLAWGRLIEACGIDAPAAGAMRIWAETAWHDLARRDPYVNMLRGTAGCFAAAAGGAEAISVRPFDEATSVPGLFGRRIARNTGLVLAQEAGLARVLDPAGGSWYIESVTEALAAKGWAVFQEIEKAGGILAARIDGTVAKLIGRVKQARAERLARRAEPLTGVSIFPNLAEPLVSQSAIDWAGLAAETKMRAGRARTPEADAKLKALKSTEPAARVEMVMAALGAGETIERLETVLGHRTIAPALKPERLAEPFEALRDAADALPRRPQIFLANWGRPRDYLESATFARNLFAVGGIEAVGGAGFEDKEALLKAARESGAKLIVLCTSAQKREAEGAALAGALKTLAPARLYAIGTPDEALKKAGVDETLEDGMDVLALLGGALSLLGARA